MKKKLREGDVFLIPLVDGSFGVGQLINISSEALNSVICAFYELRLENEDKYCAELLSENQIISVQFVTPDLLENKTWEVVDNNGGVNVNDYINLNEIISKKYIGVKVIGSGNIKKFISAYFGLHPWNFWFKPDYCDSLLLEGVDRPTNIIFE